jgi:hypothetical protein
MVEIMPSRNCPANRAVRALEQDHAEGVLQLANLAAERWLTYVALVRRPAEVPFSGNGHDIFQVAYVHKVFR